MQLTAAAPTPLERTPRARGRTTHPSSTRTGGPDPTGPDRLARALARWYVEALAGRRDTRALGDLLTPAVAQRVRCAVLREAARRHAGRGTQSAVVSVRACRLHRVVDRYEATVVVDDGARATAVVAAFHRRGDGWVVSELARPEDGLPPLRPPWLATASGVSPRGTA